MKVCPSSTGLGVPETVNTAEVLVSLIVTVAEVGGAGVYPVPVVTVYVKDSTPSVMQSSTAVLEKDTELELAGIVTVDGPVAFKSLLAENPAEPVKLRLTVRGLVPMLSLETVKVDVPPSLIEVGLAVIETRGWMTVILKVTGVVCSSGSSGVVTLMTCVVSPKGSVEELMVAVIVVEAGAVSVPVFALNVIGPLLAADQTSVVPFEPTLAMLNVAVVVASFSKVRLIVVGLTSMSGSMKVTVRVCVITFGGFVEPQTMK